MPEGDARGGPIIVVSPHPDDAAYSIGGLLSSQVLGPVFGVTAFTQSQAMTYGEPLLSRTAVRALSLLSSQLGVNRISRSLRVLEVTRVRRLEDVRYFRAIGARRADFDLLDAPLRGYGWSPFVSSLDIVRRDPIIGVVARMVTNLVAAVASAFASPPSDSTRCTLLLPLGLGNHVDHLILREACSGLLQNQVSVYYEDLPYAARLPLEDIEAVVRDFDSELTPHSFNIEASLVRKVENLRLYKSQVKDKEVGWVLAHANRLGAGGGPCERLWYGELPEDSRVAKALGQAAFRRPT